VARTLKLTIAYDGTDFAGWQRQPNERTVEGVLEDAIRAVTGEPTSIVGSGRTDAGVHALGQVASWETDCRIPLESIASALNANLPADVVVLNAAEARVGFHAIRDAARKRYRYRLHDGPVQDVFRRRYVWHVRYTLDAARMHEAGQALLGRHDFRSFESKWPNRATSVRTIFDLSVRRETKNDGDEVVLEVEADGFLYNMVRSIAGTLVEIGRGAQEIAWAGEVLAAQDRAAAGPTAPPQGLFLVRVEYPEPALAGEKLTDPPSRNQTSK